MYTAEDRAQIRRAAEAGVADSQYQLGVIYEEGKGVKQDFDEAVKWYRAAAEQGFSEAQYTLGFMYADGVGLEQDDSVAVEWWLKASENGHPMAQCNLGGSYFDAIGVPEDRGGGLEMAAAFSRARSEGGAVKLGVDAARQPYPSAAAWHCGHYCPAHRC